MWNPKIVPQENKEIVDTSEEEEDPEEVEPYGDSKEIESYEEKDIEECEQNDEEDPDEQAPEDGREAQEENSKEPYNDNHEKDKDLVYYRAEEYHSYRGGNMVHNIQELLDRIGITSQPLYSIKKVFHPRREECIAKVKIYAGNRLMSTHYGRTHRDTTGDAVADVEVVMSLGHTLFDKLQKTTFSHIPCWRLGT
jgi:hypothetical protein